MASEMIEAWRGAKGCLDMQVGGQGFVAAYQAQGVLKMMKTILMAAALAGITISMPAMASKPSVVVHASDLNLGSRAGRQELERRIAYAAGRVCSVPGDRSLVEFRESRRCAAGAISNARMHIAAGIETLVVASR